MSRSSRDAVLKMARPKLELFSDLNMHLMIKKGFQALHIDIIEKIIYIRLTIKNTKKVHI